MSGKLLLFLALLAPSLFAGPNTATFEFSGVPESIPAGSSAVVTIQAMTASGHVDATVSDELPLEILQRQADTIIFTELETTNRVVELANPTSFPIDISGWDFRVEAGSDSRPEIRGHLRFPEGSIIPPNTLFLVAQNPIANAPGQIFHTTTPPRDWLYAYYTLRNRSGQIVDQIASGGPNLPPMSEAIWRGPALPARPGPWARIGSENHFGVEDWVANNTASRGLPNPGLQLPWAGSERAVRRQSIRFANGVWTGSVNFDIGAGVAVLRVRDDLNHVGRSAQISVQPLPQLSLNLPSAALQASETAPGEIRGAQISISSPAGADLQIALASSDPSELEVPASATILANQTSATFNIIVKDDQIADGAALVTFTTTAPGYAPAEAKLTNRDNEAGQIFVVLPNRANEDTGYHPESGRVFLDQPATKDVFVNLRADPILSVPESVVIPRGRTSAAFRIAVNNDQLYSFDFRPRVYARTENWPEASGSIIVVDNEPREFTVQWPSIVWEGEPAELILNFPTPRHTDIQVQISSSYGHLEIPATTTLPAGQNQLRIPIRFNGSAPTSDRVYVTADGLTFDRQIALIQSVPDIHALTVNFARWAVFSGEELPLSATLGSILGAPQKTNVVGTLRLIDPAGRLNFQPREIQFVNGAWAGSVTLNGEASSLQFELSAASFTAQTMKFDLLGGGVRRGTPLDAVFHERSGQFIVSEGPANNAMGRIITFQPRTPNQAERSIPLESPAVSISLTDDGAFAWLALANGRAQKLNLLDWSLENSFDVSPEPEEIAQQLLALPGANNRFVALIGRPGTAFPETRLQLFIDGAAHPITAAAQPGYTSRLLRGRNGSEFFHQGGFRLGRYTVGEGVALATEAPGVDFGSQAMFAADALYSAAGMINPDTLAVTNPFQFALASFVFPRPDLGRLFALEQVNMAAFDTASGERLGELSIANLFATTGLQRALNWTDGFAFLMNDGVAVFTSPFTQSARPDLAIAFVGPAAQSNNTMPTYFPPATTVAQQFQVTNEGPGRAPAVTVRAEGQSPINVGTLEEGERRIVTFNIGTEAGIVRTTAEAVSTLIDANPANNRATGETVIHANYEFPGFVIPIAATSLAASPDRQTLYAGFSLLYDSAAPGVAVIDSTSGQVTRILAGPAAPTQIAVSADLRYIYGVTGPERVTRWNLQTGEIDLTVEIPGERIFRIALSPTLADRVVIATDKTTAVYAGGTRLANAVNRATEFRWIAFAGADLWMSERGALYRYTVGNQGLTQSLGPIQFQIFTDHYVFASDGQRLYFDSYIFDTTSRQTLGGPATAGFLFFPESNSYISLVGLDALVFNRADNRQIAQERILYAPLGHATGVYDSVRVGDRSFATITHGRQIAIYPLASVPLALPAADISVQIIPPAQPVSNFEWQIRVSNQSAAPAQNVRLTLARPDSLQQQHWEPAEDMSFFYTTVFDLGELAPGASRVVTLRGSNPTASNIPVAASVVSNSPDPNRANNQAAHNIFLTDPPGDLAISLESPLNIVDRGQEVLLRVRIANQGSTDCGSAGIYFGANDAIEFPAGTPDATPLAAGEAKTIETRVRFTQPGWIPLTAGIVGALQETDTWDNSLSTLVFVRDPSAQIPDLNFPPRTFVWSEPRQELVATFPSADWAVFGLDSQTMEPRWKVAVSGPPQLFHVTDDGAYVWVLVGEQRAERINIATRNVDRSFNVSESSARFFSVASPPGDPDTLLVSLDRFFNGIYSTYLFRNGVPQGNTIPRGGHIIFMPNGGLFIAGPQMLREYRLENNGFTEVANHDALAPATNFSFTVAGDLIYFTPGNSFNTATGQAGPTYVNTIVADHATRQAYHYWTDYQSDGRQLGFIGGVNLSTRRTEWQAPTPDLPFNATLTPMGEHGVLYSGTKVRRYNFNSADRAADLALSATLAPDVSGPNVQFALNIAVTNRSIWLADSAALTVNIPAGAQLLSDGWWVTVPQFTAQLGDFYGGTNFTLQLRSGAPGELIFTGSAQSPLRDPAPGDNSFSVATVVAPPPMLLIDDVVISENGGAITAWLSSPAIAAIDVPFTASPLTGQASDIAAVSGNFRFSAGAISAAASIIANDNVPELTETIRVSFPQGVVTPVRNEITVAIVNDDLPRLSTSMPSTTEGNLGEKTVTMNFTLTPAAPFASEAEYETLPGTAAAGEDYIAQSGRIRFAAGETSKTIAFRILGDTQFEAHETFTIALRNADSLAIQNATVTATIRNDDSPPPFNLRITGLTDASLILEFDALPNVTYQLLTRPDAATGIWTFVPIAPAINGPTGTFTIPRPPSGSNSFYEIRATTN